MEQSVGVDLLSGVQHQRKVVAMASEIERQLKLPSFLIWSVITIVLTVMMILSRYLYALHGHFWVYLIALATIVCVAGLSCVLSWFRSLELEWPILSTPARTRLLVYTAFALAAIRLNGLLSWNVQVCLCATLATGVTVLLLPRFVRLPVHRTYQAITWVIWKLRFLALIVACLSFVVSLLLANRVKAIYEICKVGSILYANGQNPNDKLFFIIPRAWLADVETVYVNANPFSESIIEDSYNQHILYPIEESTIVALHSFKRIRKLVINAPDGAPLKHLPRFEDLQELELRVAKEADTALADLEENRQHLTILVLFDSDVTDKGLQFLSDAKQLRYLSLDRTRVSAKGLAALANANQLRDISLDETRVAGAELTEISKLKSLESLWLNLTKVTDDNLLKLKSRSLEAISISGTSVTSASLQYINPENFADLQWLVVAQTDISPISLRDYRRKWPDVRISPNSAMCPAAERAIAKRLASYPEINDSGQLYGLTFTAYELDPKRTKAEALVADLMRLPDLRMLEIEDLTSSDFIPRLLNRLARIESVCVTIVVQNDSKSEGSSWMEFANSIERLGYLVPYATAGYAFISKRGRMPSDWATSDAAIAEYPRV